MACYLWNAGRRPAKVRKEETVYAPRSLFDRPSPALAKLRRDLKLQKFRGIVRPPIPLPNLTLKTPALPIRPIEENENTPEWLVHEDWILLQAVQNLLELPLNLVILTPAHTPNWDLVADMVNSYSRSYRSPKQCRNRFVALNPITRKVFFRGFFSHSGISTWFFPEKRARQPLTRAPRKLRKRNLWYVRKRPFRCWDLNYYMIFFCIYSNLPFLPKLEIGKCEPPSWLPATIITHLPPFGIRNLKRWRVFSTRKLLLIGFFNFSYFTFLVWYCIIYTC
jgi:hypothetical protein